MPVSNTSSVDIFLADIKQITPQKQKLEREESCQKNDLQMEDTNKHTES